MLGYCRASFTLGKSMPRPWSILATSTRRHSSWFTSSTNSSARRNRKWGQKTRREQKQFPKRHTSNLQLLGFDVLILFLAAIYIYTYTYTYIYIYIHVRIFLQDSKKTDVGFPGPSWIKRQRIHLRWRALPVSTTRAVTLARTLKVWLEAPLRSFLMGNLNQPTS